MKKQILLTLLLFSFFAPKDFEKKIPDLSKEKDIAKISKDIKEGKIDVGKEYGMEIGQRWHNIHSEVLEIDCESCHKESYPENYLYQRKHKLPLRDAPGVVQRELCYQCHKESGKAITKLYGEK